MCDTLFDALPTEVVISLIRWVRYDDLVAISTIIPTVNNILKSTNSMKALIRQHFISVHQEIPMKRYSIDQLHRLYLRHQAIHSKQYSIGSEMFVPIHKVITYAHIHHLHGMKRYLNNIVYDPIPVCRALGFVGDERCLKLAGTSGMRVMCLRAALIGAIEGGTWLVTKLLIELKREYLLDDLREDQADGIYQPIIETCIKHRAIRTLKYVIEACDELDIDIMGDALYSMSISKLSMLADIIKDPEAHNINNTYIQSLRSIYLDEPPNYHTGIPPGIIRSTKMIDALHHNMGCVWTSLFLGLDGTQHSYDLLLYCTEGVDMNDIITTHVQHSYRSRHNVPHSVKMQIVGYVQSLVLSPEDKLRVSIYGGAVDLECTKPLIDLIATETLDVIDIWNWDVDIQSFDTIVYIVDRMTMKYSVVWNLDPEINIAISIRLRGDLSMIHDAMKNVESCDEANHMMYLIHIQEESYDVVLGWYEYAASLRYTTDICGMIKTYNPIETHDLRHLLSIAQKMGITGLPHHNDISS